MIVLQPMSCIRAVLQETLFLRSRGLLLAVLWILARIPASEAFLRSTKGTFLSTQGYVAQKNCEPSFAVPEDNRFESFDVELVEALDLDRIMRIVTLHSGTARGRRALLNLVGDEKRQPNKAGSYRGLSRYEKASRVSVVPRSDLTGRGKVRKAKLAVSASKARREYEKVEQAMLVLQASQNLTYPPLYGKDSGPFDTEYVAETDFDEWMMSSADSWTLEEIIFAEKLCQMIVDVHDWSKNENVAYWAPLLVTEIDSIDAQPIRQLLGDLKGAVEITRVRSLTDPNARSTFSFILSESKFPALRVLRQRLKLIMETDAAREGGNSKKVQDFKDEIQGKEFDIQEGLNMRILSRLNSIHDALDCVAALDIIFTKAAFGLAHSGVVPQIRDEGSINVVGFVHPLLHPRKARDRETMACPVPIDLQLSRGKRALIIGGPNGGGKTLAMKSFGVVSCFIKVGLPIPLARNQMTSTRVDYFHDILTSIGDHQNVEEGESTFMALINGYSRILLSLEDRDESLTSLILLDELGSGTEALAGGAIAQSIVEKMIEYSGSQVVATTHSSRLKSLSFNAENFECATTLSTKVENSKYKQPLFQLSYGVIGESNALGAASRSNPPLAPGVLVRAESLIQNEVDGPVGKDASYVEALKLSLERQIETYRQLTWETEKSRDVAKQLQGAMVALASNYEKHLASLEDRVNDFYSKLKTEKDGFELLGETISQLRLVRKQINGEELRLRNKGLRPVGSDLELKPGDCVVVADGSELDGESGAVCAVDYPLNPSQVAVQLSGSWIEMDNDGQSSASVRVFQRHQLAVWDSNSFWEDFDSSVPSAKSIVDAKRRMNNLLSSIRTNSDQAASGGISVLAANNQPTGKKKGPTFMSSRERKAAKRKSKKK